MVMCQYFYMVPGRLDVHGSGGGKGIGNDTSEETFGPLLLFWIRLGLVLLPVFSTARVGSLHSEERTTFAISLSARLHASIV